MAAGAKNAELAVEVGPKQIPGIRISCGYQIARRPEQLSSNTKQPP